MRSLPVVTGLVGAAVLCGPGELCAQLTFVDLAPETGTTNLSYGRGAAMSDLDGDGLLDLITANDSIPNEFFRQLPDHSFDNVNGEWGIAFDDRATAGALAADFDNDGDTDVYFINGGFPGQPNQLLRNDLNDGGVFTDVSDSTGDGAVVTRNFGGTALDFNRDGHLDIFLSSPNTEPCFLLRNDGDLVFTDVSGPAGIVHPAAFRHCSSGDFDNDGWMDIAVGNFAGDNFLYRNNGDGTFDNVAGLVGAESPDSNFGLVLEDFDNDGWLDLFVPKYQFEPDPPRPSEIYRNTGTGTFANVTHGSGLTAQTDMGHNTGDFDADGYPDIYIGTGHPGWESNDLLLLVTPDGDGGFQTNDVSDSSGITSNGPTRCHGMAIGDYDQDGFVDVYTNNGGPPSSADMLEENALWRNQDNANNWAALRLTGVVSNRSAVGARSVAFTSADREVHRYLRVGHGFGNTNSPIQHFGIGADETIERIEITWPSGIIQTVFNPVMGQVTDVIELVPGDVDGDGDVDILDLLDLLAAWGPCPEPCPPTCAADLDGDCTVGILDFLLLLANWGA